MRVPWLPPSPTSLADDRSRVKFSLLDQGPFSGLLQAWRIPVSRPPPAAGGAPLPCSPPLL